MLLKLSIQEWSYDAELPKGCDDLDEPTAAYLADEIFAFSRPESLIEVKND